MTTRDEAERLVVRKLDSYYGRPGWEHSGSANWRAAAEIVGALMDAWSLVEVPADAPVEAR